jgi:hypothetical protein
LNLYLTSVPSTFFEKLIENDNLPQLPEWEEDYKDFFYLDVINPSELGFPKNVDGTDVRYRFNAIIHAQYGSPTFFEAWSNDCFSTIDFVSEPRARVFDLYDAAMDDFLKLSYFLYSDNVESITFKINLTTEQQVVEVSTINTTDFQWLLTQGQHQYILPFQFGIVGDYIIITEITDEFGNIKILESNEFEIRNPDERSFIVRFLDDILEILSAWVVAVFGGFVIKIRSNKKKSKKEENIFYSKKYKILGEIK